MIRKALYLSLAVALALTLGTPTAHACDDDSKCDVERTCEKSKTGIRCTITAKGETTAEHVRECVRTCAGAAEHTDNVTVIFEDIDGGIAVVKSSDDEKTVHALHAKADGCAKAAEAGTSCCAKGHPAKTAEGKDCPHSADKTTVKSGCSKAKTSADA